jgi:hypothetical protein
MAATVDWYLWETTQRSQRPFATHLVANHDLDALRARAADFKPEKIGKEYLKVLTPRGSV